MTIDYPRYKKIFFIKDPYNIIVSHVSKRYWGKEKITWSNWRSLQQVERKKYIWDSILKLDQYHK